MDLLRRHDETVAGAPTRLNALLSAGGLAAFWIAYGLIHLLLRAYMSETLSLDDARANETAQGLALGYQVRQPPLYSWLLFGLQELIGTGLSGLVALRYAIVALIGMAAYGATFAACNDRRWAAAASLSLVLTYSVGWSFHEWATETMVMSVACFATLHAALRFLAEPSRARSIWLGLAVGLGLMSKFSYAVFLFALIFAVGTFPELRRRLVDTRLLLTLGIALAMTVPFVWWLVSVRGDLAGMASLHLIEAQRPYLQRVFLGIARLSWSLPFFLMPWLAIVAAIAWPAFRPGQQVPALCNAAEGTGAIGTEVAPSWPERLVLRTMLIGAVLMAAGIVAIGVTNIGERYMHPVLMIAPVYAFARMSRSLPGKPYLRRFVATALVAVLLLLVARVFSFENQLFGRPTRQHAQPFAGLAKALEQRGLTGGTIVTVSVRVAGNLRQFFPAARYVADDTQRLFRPARRASDEQSCVLVWHENENGRARMLAPEPAAERIEIMAPARLRGSRRGVWFVARLDPHDRLCA